MTAKIIPIRRCAAKTLERANAQIETAFNIIGILRRRLSHPHDNKLVIIEFATEAEALVFQKLVHGLPRRRQSLSSSEPKVSGSP